MKVIYANKIGLQYRNLNEFFFCNQGIIEICCVTFFTKVWVSPGFDLWDLNIIVIMYVGHLLVHIFYRIVLYFVSGVW